MIVVSTFSSREQLYALLRGTPLASGSAGTTAAASANLSDATPGAFTDVSVGDRVYISGEPVGTTFLVQTKTDNNNLVLDNPVSSTHTAAAVWSAAVNNAIPVANIIDGPRPDPLSDGFGMLIYETSTFGVG